MSSFNSESKSNYILANGSWQQQEGHWRFQNEIEKPQLDERSYSLIKLPNDLQVLLVSDPTTDLAGVSLDVGVGHMADPDDMPGLAHFCEHLLFMGTKSFPAENEYKRYVKMHGGATNASTSSSTTTYHFQIQAPYLSGGVARFSEFFHAPLFDRGCVGREVNAVNSENSKNQQMDSRRRFQLWKSLSDKDHPWIKFGCGNKETLLPKDDNDGEIQTRRRVVDWWERHYCASRMKVAIIGCEPLDTLVDLASKNFSQIPNRGLGPPVLTTLPPWSHGSQPLLVFVKTVKNVYNMEINFPIPYQTPLYRNKPLQYISHLIGHEGPGSIFYFLQRRGLATALSCGLQSAGRGASLLNIGLSLNKNGLHAYPKVLSVIFRYFHLLERSLNDRYHFDEAKRMAIIGFNNSEKYSPQQYAKTLSQSMNEEYERQHVISQGVLDWQYDPTYMQDIIRCLTADNSRIFISSKFIREVAGDVTWEKERWYGTEYAQRPLASTDFSTLDDDEPSLLFLPEQNQFLPTSLQVTKHEVLEPMKSPGIIQETRGYTLWHKKDDQFWRPRGSIIVKIQSPAIALSLSSIVRTRVFIELVEDALKGPSYAAQLAGLSFTISFSTESLYLGVYGYNEKLFSLLTMVLNTVCHFQMDKERFAVVVEKVKREYDNAYLKQSGEVSDIFLEYAFCRRLYAAPEKRKEMEYTSLEDLHWHAKQLFETTYITMMTHGNIDKTEALSWGTHVEKLVTDRPIAPSARRPPRSLLLPEGRNFIFTALVPNSEEGNSAISYYCHIGDIANASMRAFASLLASIINEPFFNVMRTQEQLGYNVSCTTWRTTVSIGLRFRVQSARHPTYLESRIDNFIESYQGALETMSPQEFDERKRGIIDKKRERLKNMAEERTRFWSQIDAEYYDFERAEVDAREIEGMTLEAVIQRYRRYIHPMSLLRRKLSIHLVSHSIRDQEDNMNWDTKQAITPESFDNMDQLRREMHLSSAANSTSF